MIKGLSHRELQFIAQNEEFVAKALLRLDHIDLSQLPDVRLRAPVALRPTIVRDYRSLSDAEKQSLALDYWGPEAVAYFILQNGFDSRFPRHPIHVMAEQLIDQLPLRFPIDHPLENHPEAAKRFGPGDGTRKIYDLPIPPHVDKYREQNETAEQFDAHNDGLGYGGAVEAFMLFADQGPAWGGYTYFQNVIRLALLLAREDYEAFLSLFLHDAITVLRPRGKGAIKVTSPILFLGEFGEPQVFFRLPSGEYQVNFRPIEPLSRAVAQLSPASRPFAPGSSFIHLTRRGYGCIVRNTTIIHGRTPFIDMEERGLRRVLARKWFMTSRDQAEYRHVPGMRVFRKYAGIYPQLFGEDRLQGEWHWNPEKHENVRIA
jgi:hypothetical protein